MNIKLGELFENKTWKFLVPSLKGHGEVFTNKFNNDVYKLAFGIHDSSLDGSFIIHNRRPVFILCDKSVNSRKFESFLDWIKYQDYYITDYSFDANNPRLHMLVLEVPLKYFNAYDKYTVGLYSEMYTKEDLEVLIKNKESEAFKILSKDSSYRDFFIDKVEKEFETIIDDRSVFSNSELEFPYTLGKNDEIFNYEGI